MNPSELRTRIEEYVEAINARDADAIAAHFAEDAVQADPASNAPNLGRPAIAAFFRDGVAGSESWTFSAPRVHTCGDQAAIDFVIDVSAGGSTMTVSGIEVFAVRSDGLFSSVHAYWDDADVQLG